MRLFQYSVASFKRQQPLFVIFFTITLTARFFKAIMTDDGIDHYHYHFDDFYQAGHSLVCSFLETREGLKSMHVLILLSFYSSID